MQKSTVMLVDSDRAWASKVESFLRGKGLEALAFADGPECLDYVEAHGTPRIALLSLALPSMHGFELARALKAMWDLPIIFVTTNGGGDGIIDGLRKYGEDFIVKPFDFCELQIRIDVALARMPSFDATSGPVIRVDDNLSVDFARSQVTVAGKLFTLTPIESAMLHTLLRNATRVVDSQKLIARVWPADDVREDTLRVHIHRLRRKLEADSHHPHYIRTERGVGYRFTQDPIG